MAATVGTAPDGMDRLTEMIKSVKAAGAYHHTCFDEQFGVEAFAKVKEEESRRLRRQAEEEELNRRRQEHTNSNGSDEDNNAEENSETQADKAQQKQSTYTRPQSAKQRVETTLYARSCLVNANLKQPYTQEEIENIWKRAYRQFGTPHTAEAWVEDQLYVWQKQVEWEQKQPPTDADIADLWIEADRKVAQTVEG